MFCDAEIETTQPTSNEPNDTHIRRTHRDRERERRRYIVANANGKYSIFV